MNNRFESNKVMQRVFGTMFLAFASSCIAVGCSAASADDLGSVESPAKVGKDTTDCFESCKQNDYDTLTKDGLDKACATLQDGWKKPKDKTKDTIAWPGWDPKKPICIGHRKGIEGRGDCNRLVDAPGWTECNNELMLVCSKEKKPGFGPIILVPPPDGFPAARKPPSVTDQELACIAQWKCPTTTTKTKAVSFGVAAQTCAVTDGVSGSCGCDSSWVTEEAASPETPAPTTDSELQAPAFDD